MKQKQLVSFLVIFLVIASGASSHSGGLDANGGHWNRKTGTYHYHRAPTVSLATTTTTTIKKAGDEVASVVYITKTGSKYHRDGCQYLRSSKIEILKKDAIARGFSPCSVCKP